MEPEEGRTCICYLDDGSIRYDHYYKGLGWSFRDYRTVVEWEYL